MQSSVNLRPRPKHIGYRPTIGLTMSVASGVLLLLAFDEVDDITSFKRFTCNVQGLVAQFLTTSYIT